MEKKTKMKNRKQKQTEEKEAMVRFIEIRRQAWIGYV